MLPPRDVAELDREQMSKDDLEGIALSFPDSGSAGNTDTGNAGRRCLLTDHLRERLVATVPEEHQEDFRYEQHCYMFKVDLVSFLGVL